MALNYYQEGDQVPLFGNWRIGKPGDRVIVLYQVKPEGILCAPLYRLQFSMLQPARLTEPHRFVAGCADPRRLTTTADKLRYYRCQKLLRQRDVAACLGIDRATYVEYEKGLPFYLPDKLTKLAELLGLPPEELICDDYTRFLYQGQGEQVRNQRRQLGLTQQRLAQLLEVHPGTVKKWEAETVRMERVSWDRFCRLYLKKSNAAG